MSSRKTRGYRWAFAVLVLAAIACGCEGISIRDTRSLLFSGLQKSEVWGFVAGLGTTFAAVPDLIAMFKRRSSAGVHVRMAEIVLREALV